MPIISVRNIASQISLPSSLHSEICRLAEKYDVNQVVLFGSRAKGTNRERSDIDLFVYGQNIDDFRYALDEEAETLLKFDVVDASGFVSDELKSEVEKFGVKIYEKV